MKSKMKLGTWLLIGTLALTFPVYAKPKTKNAKPSQIVDCTNILAQAPVPEFVSGKKILPLPKTEKEREAYENFLRDRYGFKKNEIVWGKKYPMIIHGGDEASFTTKADFKNAKTDPGEYDAVIIGGGPAGLSAGTYLTDAGKKILILEKESTLGGLAAGGQTGRVRYGRGAAYFTAMEGEIYEMYKHLGFGQYKKKYTIKGATDSYFWNGKLYHDLWENPETMAELPQSFSLFQYYLKHADKMGLIPNQPFDEFPNLILDTMTMETWVKTFPEEMRKLAGREPEAKVVYDRFLADPNVDPVNPMADPLNLLNLYGRSALGGETPEVSAAGFANFYISELDARYTGDLGTGSTMESVLKKLKKRDNLVTIKTGAPLAKIRTTENGVEFYYVKNGVTYKGKAKDAVYGAQLSTGLNTIENYEKIAPEHYKTVKSLKYRNYLVINAHVEGHPWKKTYDTWMRNDPTYTQNDFTDLIDGRWHEFQGENLPRTDNRGVLSIYKPLPESEVSKGYGNARSLELSETALEEMKTKVDFLSKTYDEGKPVHILAAEVSQWPYSIHLTEQGHYTTRAPILRKNVGNIYFANNNLGTPSIEEGIYSGYRAAKKILKKQGIAPGAGKIQKTKPKPNTGASFRYESDRTAA